MVFIESRSFSRRLRELAGEHAMTLLRNIQQDLMQNPLRGDMVRGLGGVRKARAGRPGEGKRGGVRYFYLYLERRSHIHLLALLSKREQADLSEEERKVIRNLAGALRNEREEGA